jgi:hypothetical protein
VNVRGVFTSDIEYQIHTLPKDIQFKLPKDSDWFSLYSWFNFPQDQKHQELNKDLDEQIGFEKKENSSTKANMKYL